VILALDVLDECHRFARLLPRLTPLSRISAAMIETISGIARNTSMLDFPPPFGPTVFFFPIARSYCERARSLYLCWLTQVFLFLLPTYIFFRFPFSMARSNPLLKSFCFGTGKIVFPPLCMCKLATQCSRSISSKFPHLLSLSAICRVLFTLESSVFCLIWDDILSSLFGSIGFSIP